MVVIILRVQEYSSDNLIQLMHTGSKRWVIKYSGIVKPSIYFEVILLHQTGSTSMKLSFQALYTTHRAFNIHEKTFHVIISALLQFS